MSVKMKAIADLHDDLSVSFEATGDANTHPQGFKEALQKLVDKHKNTNKKVKVQVKVIDPDKP